MGQTVSKVANRVVGTSTSSTSTSSSKVIPKHIPSIPGKDAASLGKHNTMIIDPLTGFTRGTSPLTPSEERQRQFLEERQYDMIQRHKNERSTKIASPTKGIKSNNSTTTTTIPTTTTSTAITSDTKMPDDLLKFLNDIGPVVRTQNASSSSTGNNDQDILQTKQQRPVRVPRISKFTNEMNSPGTEIMNSNMTITTGTANTGSQNPSHDKTRQIVNMPLVNDIPGFETSRTTSFSTKPDIIDPNDIGLTMVQLYSILLSSSSPTSTEANITTTTTTNNNTTTTTTPTHVISKNNEQQQLIDNAKKYLQIPVMLKDSDGSYIGTYPEEVIKLLGTHRGMIILDTQTRAKLILQEIYDKDIMKQQLLETNDNNNKNDTTTGTNSNNDNNGSKESDVYTEIDLGPKRQRR